MIQPILTKIENFVLHILKWKINYLTNQKFIIFCSFLVGLGAGFMAYLLRSSVYYTREILHSDFHFNRHWIIILLPIIGITLTVILKCFLHAQNINYNISDLLHAISKRKSYIRPHKIYSSVIGATFTAGFGGSVGLESPVIMSGAAIGSSLGRWFKFSYKEITLLLACGSAGAIAGVFNTPIAAVIFALEVLMLDISRYSLIPLLISSITGAITSRLLFSKALILNFPVAEQYATLDLLYFVLLGIFAGFLSYYFAKIYLFFETQLKKLKKPIYRILIGGIVLGIMLFLFPSLYGEGYDVTKDILLGNFHKFINNSIFKNSDHGISIVFLFFIVLFLFKVIATSFTINSGGIGGFIAPSMFTGTMFGVAFVLILNQYTSTSLSIINFSLVSMAAMLSGILHAPLTSIFLIAEMTKGYQLFLPLMLTATISYIVSRSLLSNSILTIQLAQKGELITHNKDRAILSFMQLDNLLETNFSSIHSNAKLRELVEVIAHSNRNIIPVINDEQILLGTIHLNDVRETIFHTKLYDTVTVNNLMVKPPEIIQYTDNMKTVIEKFQKTNVWNLPVVYNGKYIGFISKSNMFNEYRKHLLYLSTD